MATRWPRDLWLDAIWEDESLGPNERAVAYVYARYAGKNDTAWCTWGEIMKRTGMRSKRTVNAALAVLIEAGWLSEVERPRQHMSAVYRLTVPAQRYLSATAEPVDNSASGSNLLPLNGSPAVASSHPAVAISTASGSKLLPHIRDERSDERSDLSERAASLAPGSLCRIHQTHVNGSGVCSLCRSEQIGSRS